MTNRVNVDGVTSYDLSYVLMFILSQTHLLIYYHQLEVRFGQGLRVSLTNIYILKMSMDKFLKITKLAEILFELVLR